MTRRRRLPSVLILTLLGGSGLFACDTRPLPAPPEPAPSASVAPMRSTPFAPVSAVMASASAAPSQTPMPGLPPLDTACTKDDECGSTFYDVLCCTDCVPRLGTKASAKKVDTFCKEHKPASCPKPGACGFVFGTPRCMNGRCVAR